MTIAKDGAYALLAVQINGLGYRLACCQKVTSTIFCRYVHIFGILKNASNNAIMHSDHSILIQIVMYYLLFYTYKLCIETVFCSL